jgi:hypothetical protein
VDLPDSDTDTPQPTTAPQPTSEPQPTTAPQPTIAPQPTSVPPDTGISSDQPAVPGGNSGNNGSNGSGGYNDSSGNNGSGGNGNPIGDDRSNANTAVGSGSIVSDSSVNSSAGIDVDAAAANTANTGTSAEPVQAQPSEITNVPNLTVAEASAPVPGTTQPQETDGDANAVEGGASDVIGEIGTGAYTIDYDGTGPFVVRIDIPMESFREMYFDGAIWTPGTDYEVRSGSTILTIPEARLESVAEGSHRISAVFDDQTVNIDFILQKASANEALAPTAESSPITPVAIENSIPLVPMITLTLLAVTAAVIGIRAFRQRKAATK